MRIFKFINDWYIAKKQKHIDNMKKKGKCPDCHGYGFSAISGYYSGVTFDCHMCKGTGLYSEWEKSKSVNKEIEK